MKTDLKSKFIDGLLSAVIMMVIMFPLIMVFRVLNAWGTLSYWAAVILFMVAGTWMLYRSTLDKLSEVGRGWYGIVGGLLAWTVSELSHELGMLDIEQSDILIVLVLLLLFLYVMWKYFPVGPRFWVVIFLMNWVGHVFIHVGQDFLAASAAKTLFTLTAAAYGLLLIGLIYWIFGKSKTRVGRLWAGLWIWHALSMVYFLMR